MVKPNNQIEPQESKVSSKEFKKLKNFYQFLKKVPVRIGKAEKVGKDNFTTISKDEYQSIYSSLKNELETTKISFAVPDLPEGNPLKKLQELRSRIKESKDYNAKKLLRDKLKEMQFSEQHELDKAKKARKATLKKIRDRKLQRLSELYSLEAETGSLNPITKASRVNANGVKGLVFSQAYKREETDYRKICETLGCEDEADNFQLFYESNTFITGKDERCETSHAVGRVAKEYFKAMDKKSGVVDEKKLRNCLTSAGIKFDTLNNMNGDPIYKLFRENIDTKAGTILSQCKRVPRPAPTFQGQVFIL